MLYCKSGNRPMTPVVAAFGALFLLHLVVGLAVALSSWPGHRPDLQLHLPLLLLPLTFWAMPPWPAAWVARLFAVLFALLIMQEKRKLSPRPPNSCFGRASRIKL